MKWQSAIVKGFDLYINSTGSFGRKLCAEQQWIWLCNYLYGHLANVYAFLHSFHTGSDCDFFMVIYIAVKLWKFIDWKLLLPPVIMATVTSLLGVNTLMALDEAVLSKIMGTVLLVLAVYFIFFSSKVHLKAGLVSGLAAGAVSGFCGGLFNIGGPPMVAYFLSVTDDKEKI
ncbi:sulfite exporter TauE/SafE family protein [Blautia wexlerae]|nr:sulfite exporter TauE/SafE family protein [Blautia wexlerae]